MSTRRCFRLPACEKRGESRRHRDQHRMMSLGYRRPCENLVLATGKQLAQIRQSAQIAGLRPGPRVVPAKAVAELLQEGDRRRGAVDELALVLLEHQERLVRPDGV